tara:strand:+ start:2826 stop:3722 length:897 start_codon:yes stop_codon:yes gene_type:complete
MKLTKDTLRLLIEEEVKNIFEPCRLHEYYDNPKYQQKTEIQQISTGDILFYNPHPKQDAMVKSPIEIIRISIVDPSAADKMGLPGMVDGIVGLSLPTYLVAQPSDTIFFYDKPEMDKLASALSKAAKFAKAASKSNKPMQQKTEVLMAPQEIETLGGVRTYQESEMGGRTGAVPVFLDKTKPTMVKVGAVKVYSNKDKKPLYLVALSLKTAVKYDTAKSFHSPMGGIYDVSWEHGEDQDESTAYLPPQSAEKLAIIIRSHMDEIGTSTAGKPLAALPTPQPLAALPVNRKDSAATRRR